MKYFILVFNIVLIFMIGTLIFYKTTVVNIAVGFTYKSLKTTAFRETVIQLRKEILEKEVLERQIGDMSSYGPDCVGCSGHLAGGYDATSGNYIYIDPTYGEVRVVAADSKYPYGTIVRIIESGREPFKAIVLDRGGAIGFNRTFLFDLLCSSESEAALNGTHRNLTFEILRYGY